MRCNRHNVEVCDTPDCTAKREAMAREPQTCRAVFDDAAIEIALPASVLLKHWIDSVNDPEIQRILFLPIVRERMGHLSIGGGYIPLRDIRRLFEGPRRNSLDTDLLKGKIANVHALRPDLFPSTADTERADAAKKLADAWLVDLQWADPGVAPSGDVGGRPRRGVDFGMYEKPGTPDGPST